MKKIILIAAIGIGFTSCKKEYDCTCSYNNGTTIVTEVYDVGKSSEDDANSTCSTKKVSLETSGGTEVSCAASAK